MRPLGRRLGFLVLVVAVSTMGLSTAFAATNELPYGGTFVDDNGSVHEGAIEAIAAIGVTRGCNPPLNTKFCPKETVTRGQMAAFLVRALKLADRGDSDFVDDDFSIFEADIEKLSRAGITRGCNPPENTKFCPLAKVTRGQMAAFLRRAFSLAPAKSDYFADDRNSIFEGDINAIAAAGITTGCNPPENNRFCPDELMRRDEMATFLVRGLGLDLIDLPDRWELIFSDEFNASAGTYPNSAFWTPELRDGVWNQELQHYTGRYKNASQNGKGSLVITALREKYTDGECWYGECEYTSARLITRDKVEFKYGRVEFRAKLPSGQGIWPALWMLGGNITEVGWPASGEIDIVELYRDPTLVRGAIHMPDASIGGTYRASESLSSEYYTYAIEWSPNEVRWEFDGVVYAVVGRGNVSGTWVFDNPFYLVMNIAIGGSSAGDPDETTEFPVKMYVDYVRVYQAGK